MAVFGPFDPTVKAATTGFTQSLTCTTASTSINLVMSTSFVGPMDVLRVTNITASTAAAFVRISTEANPTATTNDTPIAANAVALFAAPGSGNIGIAIIVSNTLNTVFFTPGKGGAGI